MTFLPKMRRSTDKYLTDAASGIAGLQKTIIERAREIAALKEALAASRANQRTPGTVERCRLCNGWDFENGHCSYSTEDSRRYPSGCPAIRDAQAEAQPHKS